MAALSPLADALRRLFATAEGATRGDLLDISPWFRQNEQRVYASVAPAMQFPMMFSRLSASCRVASLQPPL
jgi:hypothetical protein